MTGIEQTFETVDEVDRLKVQHFDWDDPVDRSRLQVIFQQRCTLENHLNMPCVPEVKDVEDIRRCLYGHRIMMLFHARQTACVCRLKLMHVVQHLDAAELRHQAPLPKRDC